MSHPLHQFTYCPKCGARTFVERNEKAKQCVVVALDGGGVACARLDDIGVDSTLGQEVCNKLLSLHS